MGEARPVRIGPATTIDEYQSFIVRNRPHSENPTFNHPAVAVKEPRGVKYGER